MRTYEDCFRDYCKWLVSKTGNLEYEYDTMLKNDDVNTVKSFLYKSILNLCYDKKDGFFYFCKFIIGDLLDIGYPNPLRYNTLLRKWDKLVKKHKKLAILCARGHGKSVFFTQLLNIYDMFLFKFRRVILISASQEQANRLLEETKTIIDNNEWLSTKKNENKWARETIGYNGGYILVAGIGSEILGQHVDRIVIDDILRSDNKLTDEEVEDYIDMNLDPMLLNRNGQEILVGTPKREQDIFATIFQRKKEDPKCPWQIHRYPAITDYEKKIIQCPDRFTWDSLMEKRLSMGPLKFAREYQLEFFSRDTSLFPRKIVDPAKKKGTELSLLNKADKRPPNWTFVIGVDVARSGSVSADYTVAVVLAYDSVSQAKIIAHMLRIKGKKITTQAVEISNLAKRFNNCMVVVETNNMGQEMVDNLTDVHNVYVEPITVSPKNKEELVRFLITAFENEQMVIPRGDEDTRREMDILESELAKYCVTRTPAGNEKFEGVGSHDDIVDALTLANKGTQIGGIPFAVTSETTTSVYGALTERYNSNESDLVKQIKMGIIK
jgi:hypothetical protein